VATLPAMGRRVSRRTGFLNYTTEMGNVQDTKSSPCSHSPLAPTLPIPNSSSQDGQQNGTTQTGHPVGPASRPFTHISRPQKSECEADISSEKCGFDVARAGDGTCLPCTMH
jgi:hypothetical protein